MHALALLAFAALFVAAPAGATMEPAGQPPAEVNPSFIGTPGQCTLYRHGLAILARNNMALVDSLATDDGIAQVWEYPKADAKQVYRTVTMRRQTVEAADVFCVLFSGRHWQPGSPINAADVLKGHIMSIPGKATKF